MNKEIFNETEIEVVKFNATDVICTSDPLTKIFNSKFETDDYEL